MYKVFMYHCLSVNQLIIAPLNIVLTSKRHTATYPLHNNIVIFNVTLQFSKSVIAQQP